MEPGIREDQLSICGEQPTRWGRHAEPVLLVLSGAAATGGPAWGSVLARGLSARCFRLQAPAALVSGTGRAQPSNSGASNPLPATPPASASGHQGADAQLPIGLRDRRIGRSGAGVR